MSRYLGRAGSQIDSLQLHLAREGAFEAHSGGDDLLEDSSSLVAIVGGDSDETNDVHIFDTASATEEGLISLPEDEDEEAELASSSIGNNDATDNSTVEDLSGHAISSAVALTPKHAYSNDSIQSLSTDGGSSSSITATARHRLGGLGGLDGLGSDLVGGDDEGSSPIQGSLSATPTVATFVTPAARASTAVQNSSHAATTISQDSNTGAGRDSRSVTRVQSHSALAAHFQQQQQQHASSLSSTATTTAAQHQQHTGGVLGQQLHNHHNHHPSTHTTPAATPATASASVIPTTRHRSNNNTELPSAMLHHRHQHQYQQQQQQQQQQATTPGTRSGRQSRRASVLHSAVSSPRVDIPPIPMRYPFSAASSVKSTPQRTATSEDFEVLTPLTTTAATAAALGLNSPSQRLHGVSSSSNIVDSSATVPALGVTQQQQQQQQYTTNTNTNTNNEMANPQLQQQQHQHQHQHQHQQQPSAGYRASGAAASLFDGRSSIRVSSVRATNAANNGIPQPLGDHRLIQSSTSSVTSIGGGGGGSGVGGIPSMPALDNKPVLLSSADSDAEHAPLLAKPSSSTATKPTTKSKSSSSNSSAGGKLGTMEGVFVPVGSSLWTIIFFVRMGYVICHAGVAGSVALFSASYIIALMTALSLSAIATNGIVRSGGVYYMASRTLGPEFGGSVGIMFYMATLLNGVLAAVAFAEPILATIGVTEGTLLRILPDGPWSAFILNTLLLAACSLVCACGAKAFARINKFFSMIVWVITALVFVSFAIRQPFTDSEQGIVYTGLSYDTLMGNMWPDFQGGETARSVFAVVFPVCAGIMAGASLSGDLATPSQSIPSGTLWAAVITYLAYIATVVLLGATTTRDSLYRDMNILQDVSAFPLLITLGSASTCVTSVLNGMIVSANTLHAIAQDNLLPMLGFLRVPRVHHNQSQQQHQQQQQQAASKPSSNRYSSANSRSRSSSSAGSSSNTRAPAAGTRSTTSTAATSASRSSNNNNVSTPVVIDPPQSQKALLTTFVISQVSLLGGSINAVAPFVTMFSLLTFGVMNLACLLLRLSAAPNFRPTFRYFKAWTAFLGFVLSLGAMGVIDLFAATLAILIMMLLFVTILYTAPHKAWGDVSQALIFHQVRKYLLRLDVRKEHVKFWRPQILLLVDNPRTSYGLVQFCNSLKKSGMYILGHTIVGAPFRSHIAELRRQQQMWMKFVDVSRVKAFVDLTIAPNLIAGVRNLVLNSGLGGMRPNIVVMGFFDMAGYRARCSLIRSAAEQSNRANQQQQQQQQQQQRMNLLQLPSGGMHSTSTSGGGGSGGILNRARSVSSLSTIDSNDESGSSNSLLTASSAVTSSANSSRIGSHTGSQVDLVGYQTTQQSEFDAAEHNAEFGLDSFKANNITLQLPHNPAQNKGFVQSAPATSLHDQSWRSAYFQRSDRDGGSAVRRIDADIDTASIDELGSASEVDAPYLPTDDMRLESPINVQEYICLIEDILLMNKAVGIARGFGRLVDMLPRPEYDSPPSIIRSTVPRAIAAAATASLGRSGNSSGNSSSHGAPRPERYHHSHLRNSGQHDTTTTTTTTTTTSSGNSSNSIPQSIHSNTPAIESGLFGMLFGMINRIINADSGSSSSSTGSSDAQSSSLSDNSGDRRRKYIDVWPIQMAMTTCSPAVPLPRKHRKDRSGGPAPRAKRKGSVSINPNPASSATQQSQQHRSHPTHQQYHHDHIPHQRHHNARKHPISARYPVVESYATNFDSYAMVLQLGTVLHSVPYWRDHFVLRVVCFVEHEQDVETERERVQALLITLRIEAELVVLWLSGTGLKSYDANVTPVDQHKITHANSGGSSSGVDSSPHPISSSSSSGCVSSSSSSAVAVNAGLPSISSLSLSAPVKMHTTTLRFKLPEDTNQSIADTETAATTTAIPISQEATAVALPPPPPPPMAVSTSTSLGSSAGIGAVPIPINGHRRKSALAVRLTVPHPTPSQLHLDSSDDSDDTDFGGTVAAGASDIDELMVANRTTRGAGGSGSGNTSSLLGLGSLGGLALGLGGGPGGMSSRRSSMVSGFTGGVSLGTDGTPYRVPLSHGLSRANSSSSTGGRSMMSIRSGGSGQSGGSTGTSGGSGSGGGSNNTSRRAKWRDIALAVKSGKARRHTYSVYDGAPSAFGVVSSSDNLGYLQLSRQNTTSAFGGLDLLEQGEPFIPADQQQQQHQQQQQQQYTGIAPARPKMHQHSVSMGSLPKIVDVDELPESTLAITEAVGMPLIPAHVGEDEQPSHVALDIAGTDIEQSPVVAPVAGNGPSESLTSSTTTAVPDSTLITIESDQNSSPQQHARQTSSQEQQLAPNFDSVDTRTQHKILNELMRRHTTQTAVMFTTLPVPEIGTHADPELSAQYIENLETLVRGLPPVMLIHATSLTVTTTL
ncbi:hypothetical protein GQ42DRAFT_161832 [Ramicandelaber brevisporus]|nr:hypothetical protein GQ42DRAFT_161832 [Ramicandelaber brevisporus]